MFAELRNVSKNKNFEFSHNLKWYIIRISFERVLRNIQKNLRLIQITFCFFHREVKENTKLILSLSSGRLSKRDVSKFTSLYKPLSCDLLFLFLS